VSVLEVASADGTVHASVPSRGKADTYQVQAAWGTDDAHWTLTTTVSVQPSPSTP
jgi:hypothetical protein